MRRPGPAPDHQPADIEYRHLRYFAVVAEELHFGRAAARLYISQPGLSQAIARLERQLGVRLFTRTRRNVELTEAGTELLHRGRRLLADLDGAVTRVRMAGRGETGLIRIGVAHLAEPAVAPALTAFQAEHASIAVDRSAMVSERLLDQLTEGRLHMAIIHQVPGLAALNGIRTEPLRRGRLAVLAGPESKLAGRPVVTLSELAKETFLVNPRSLAPGAFEGFKLMCREFGGFEANVLESAAASTVALGTDWQPIRGGAIAVMAETTARTVCADGIAVVPVQPPPQYVLALAWRDDEQAAAAHRCLAYLRRYRDQHRWLPDPDVTPQTPAPGKCTSRALRLRLLDDPLLRHSSAIAAAMMQAMAATLTSAGFAVEDANDEYRPNQLRVVDGPAQGVPSIWSLRDEELIMPGWHTTNPGESASDDSASPSTGQT